MGGTIGTIGTITANQRSCTARAIVPGLCGKLHRRLAPVFRLVLRLFKVVPIIIRADLRNQLGAEAVFYPFDLVIDRLELQGRKETTHAIPATFLDVFLSRYRGWLFIFRWVEILQKEIYRESQRVFRVITLQLVDSRNSIAVLLRAEGGPDRPALRFLVQLLDVILLTLIHGIGPRLIVFTDPLAVKRSRQAPRHRAAWILKLSDFEF